eukprot:PhF_6_TR13172/c0_g1_i1/m.20772
MLSHRYQSPVTSASHSCDDFQQQASPSSASSVIKPTMTTLHLVAVTFLIAIGGPYGLEATIHHAGPLITILFIVLLPWLWCLPTTLCVAELACSIPSNGGPVMWINVAFPSWFCLMIVIWTLVQQFLDNALYPSLATSYIHAMYPMSDAAQSLCKVILVCVCCILNCFGVEIVGFGSVIIMIVAIAPFVVMCVMFWFSSNTQSKTYLQTSSAHWQNIMYIPPVINWAAFLPLISWNMAGLDKSGNLAEEVRHPQHTFVRSLLVVIVLMISVYVPPLIVGVTYTANPQWEKWESGYWTYISKQIGGEVLSYMVFLGGVASSVGYLFTNICTTSRALAAMGSIGVFPSWLNNWMEHYSPRYKTPVNAILANSILLCFFSIVLEFDDLVAVDQILFSLRVMVMYVSVLVLRYHYPTLPRPFKIPGSTLWHLVAILFFGFWYNGVMVYLSLMTEGASLLTFRVTMGTLVGSLVFSLLYVVWWKRGDVVFKGRIVAVIIDMIEPTTNAIAATN